MGAPLGAPWCMGAPQVRVVMFTAKLLSKSQAKVSYSRGPLCSKKYVRGFNIAVYNPLTMTKGDTFN